MLYVYLLVLLRAMISLVAKEICDIDKFQKLCKILQCEHYYNELAESIQITFCILKCELDILAQSNYQEIFHSLKDKAFFDDHEEEMLLLGGSKIEIIIKLLKNKSLHYFQTFLFCLKSLPNCNVLVHKIEYEIANLNYHLFLKLSQSSTEQSSLINTYVDRMRNNPGPLHDFQQYFIQSYTRPSFIVTSVLDVPKIFYINLALIIVHGDEEPGFCDYDSLLFKQENTYAKEMLTSLSEIFIENQRVILIQGSPGSGKTTLAKKICMDWLEGELLQSFDLVILVELNDSRVSEVTTLRELVAFYMGDYLSESITKEITRIKGKGILILLEGWDELSEKSHHSSWFTGLISGDVLSDATIVITSRPSATGSLSYKHIHSWIEILGFTEEQVEEYITKYFQDHDNPLQIVQYVLCQLRQYPHLKRLVCVPVNLSIILFIIKQSNEQIPQTYTALYVTFLLILLNRYQEKNLYDCTKIMSLKHLNGGCIFNMLYNLGKMAYYELLHDRMTFTEEVTGSYCFHSKNSPEDFDGMGLLHVNSRVYSTHVSKTYQFIHRTLQELLAAWYLSLLPKGDQRKELLDLFSQKGSEMIWIFYGGLTKFDDIPFHNFFCAGIKQWFKIAKDKVWSYGIHFAFNKKIIRFSGVKEILATYFSTEQYSKNMSKYVSREFQTTLMAVAMEVEKPSLCKTICNSYLFNAGTCWFTVPDSAVTPQILSALSFCISASEKKWIVQCKTLDNDGANSLLQYLTCDIENCDHKTCHHANCIRMLDVYSSPEKIDGLVKIIHHQNSLEYIVLSQSISCDDSCIVKLSEALYNNTCVKIIHLLGCNLTSVGIQALASMLKFNSTVEWIALRDNRETLVEESVILLLDSIYQHNNILYMLALDSKFHQNPAVQSCLQKINTKRQCENNQVLYLKLVDCVRYSQVCQRFFTLQ